MASSLQTLGVGSGLDIQSIISSLMNAESAPLAALQNKASGIQTQISTYGQISSAYSQLQTAIKNLQSSTTQNSLLGLTTSTSSASVANASISGSAAAGSYALNVTTMAKGQQIVASTGPASSSTAIGTTAATLSIQLGSVTGGTLSGTPGTYSGSTFTAVGSATSVSVAANASLSDIRDAINTSNAGVSATIIYDGSQYRLALSSTATGVESSIKLSVTGDSDVSTLLSQDPQGTQGFQETQTASNFSGTLNGIAITGKSNTLDSTVSGLAITAYGTGTATLTVNQNANQASSAMSSFVTAWNGLNGLIKALTSYDASTKTAGPLLGDPLAGAAFSTLTNSTFGAASKDASLGNYTTLASIGMTIDSKGVASIDNAKLGAALKANPNVLANMLGSSKANLLSNAGKYVDGMVGASGIGGRTSSLNAQLTANGKQQDSWNNRLVLIKKNLTAQYTALDASVSKMQSVSSFLSNQIAQFNKSS